MAVWRMRAVSTPLHVGLGTEVGEGLQVVCCANKGTELTEGVRDAHGIRSRRREDIVDWLIRVSYKLEYCEHPI